MKISAKWIAALVAGAIATTFLSAPAQAAPITEQMVLSAITEAVADTTINPNVTQLALDILAEEKPEAYEAALAAIEPYTANDAPLSTVPADVVATIDSDVWSALVAHEAATQGAVDRGTVLTDAEQEEVEQGAAGTVWKIVKQFIKKYWSQILSAARTYGKIAWYKFAHCITGAGVYLFNRYYQNLSLLAQALAGDAVEKGTAIWTAARGCWAYVK